MLARLAIGGERRAKVREPLGDRCRGGRERLEHGVDDRSELLVAGDRRLQMLDLGLTLGPLAFERSTIERSAASSAANWARRPAPGPSSGADAPALDQGRDPALVLGRLVTGPDRRAVGRHQAFKLRVQLRRHARWPAQAPAEPPARPESLARWLGRAPRAGCVRPGPAPPPRQRLGAAPEWRAPMPGLRPSPRGRGTTAGRCRACPTTQASARSSRASCSESPRPRTWSSRRTAPASGAGAPEPESTPSALTSARPPSAPRSIEQFRSRGSIGDDGRAEAAVQRRRQREFIAGIDVELLRQRRRAARGESTARAEIG